MISWGYFRCRASCVSAQLALQVSLVRWPTGSLEVTFCAVKNPKIAWNPLKATCKELLSFPLLLQVVGLIYPAQPPERSPRLADIMPVSWPRELPRLSRCQDVLEIQWFQCVSMCIFHAFPAMPSDNWFRTKKRMFGNFWIRMSRCPRRQLFSLRNPCVSSLIRVSSDRIRRINEISQHSESEICWGFECMDASPEWVWENSATTVPCLHQNLTVKLLRFFHESSCVIELGRFPRIPESRPHGHLGRGRVLSSNFMCIMIYIYIYTHYILYISVVF